MMLHESSQVPIPKWWRSKQEEIQHFIDSRVTKGEVRVLVKSSGGRPVKAICYGEREEGLRGTANFNSAIAAGSEEYFYRWSKRKKGVLLVIGGIHGAEVEGMIGSLSLANVLETGSDISGHAQPELLAKLNALRVIIVPMANPDGRARVPYDGWVELPTDEMVRFGQGTNKRMELFDSGCMAIHPMGGDVDILGGYFDDAGVNLMHDEWWSPMSPVTRALFTLVRDEAPDVLINLHGHSYDPCILPQSYIPYKAKKRLKTLYDAYYRQLAANGYVGREFDIPGLDDEDRGDVTLNLNSMFYHIGARLPFVYESPQGCYDISEQGDKLYKTRPYGYEDILSLMNILFDSVADFMKR